MSKESEKQAALARLAARDAASLKGMGIESTADDDKIAAMSRIIGDLDIPITQARFVYDRLIRQLREADLTINLQAYKFFNSEPKGQGYVSQFAGGNTWGDGGYIAMRDEAEEAMFDYSGASTSTAPSAVRDRVTSLGKRSSTEFQGAMRPKYAALNFANLTYGSAPQWGKSYVVLKTVLKHNATFVHTDSFDMAGSATQRAALSTKVANFLNMQKLIVNMSPSMLDALYKVTNGHDFGTITTLPGLGSTAYVEAHVHSGVNFNRDIARLVISRTELSSTKTKTLALHAKDRKRWKVRTPEKLTNIFEKFCRKNGIKLEYTT